MLISDIINELAKSNVSVTPAAVIHRLEKLGVEHEKGKPYSVSEELGKQIVNYYKLKKAPSRGLN